MARNLQTNIVACSVALMLWATLSARAATTMTLDDGAGHSVSISDNGAGDCNLAAGAIVYAGSLGAWVISVDTGVSKPFVGSAVDPEMDLHFVGVSSGAGTLTVTFADDRFGPMAIDAANPKMTIGGTAAPGGSLIYSTSVNGFTTATPKLTGNPYSNTTYGHATGLSGPNPPGFGASLTIVMNHSMAGASSGDAMLIVPETSTCVAGALLLIPFALSTYRFVRKNRTA